MGGSSTQGSLQRGRELVPKTWGYRPLIGPHRRPSSEVPPGEETRRAHKPSSAKTNARQGLVVVVGKECFVSRETQCHHCTSLEKKQHTCCMSLQYVLVFGLVFLSSSCSLQPFKVSGKGHCTTGSSVMREGARRVSRGKEQRLSLVKFPWSIHR